MACPSCGANAGHLLGCEHSTLSLAPREAPAAASVPSELVGVTPRWRALAVPIALGLLGLFSFTGAGAMVLRLFFGMWLHELGHAVASWLCGRVAVPLPWVTYHGEERNLLFLALLLCGLGFAAFRLWSDEDTRPLAAIPAGILALLALGVLQPAERATQLMVFWGDGGALVFGALLMGLSTVGDESPLARGGLRWGYLVIGGGAFADVFHQWFAAWRDVAEIPFGQNEGVGLSDATRLVDVYHWSEWGLIRAYLGLGVLCLVLLAVRVARVVATADE